jgi:hypothetical protein
MTMVQNVNRRKNGVRPIAIVGVSFMGSDRLS